MSDISAIREAQRISDAKPPDDDDEEDPLEAWASESLAVVVDLQRAIADKNHGRTAELAKALCSLAQHINAENSLRWLMRD